MIVTAASNQVIVDIHDWRPLVISENAVPEWLSPDTSPSRAQDLVRNDALCVSGPLSARVGNVHHHDASLFEVAGDK